MRRRNIPELLLLVVILVVLASVFLPSFGPRPNLPMDVPSSADISVMGERLASVTNTPPLVLVLRAGKRVDPHKCAPRGEIVLHYPAAPDVKLSIAPGHSPGQYEFNMTGDSFSVSRSRFLDALRNGGVDISKIPND